MLCGLFKVPRWDSGHSAAHGVGVFTAAPRPVHSVVTPLAQLKATLGWKVTPQTRQKEGHEPHGRPPGAAVGLAAGARVVRTVVLVVVGAVIEEAFDAAHTRPVIDHVLSRAQALLVTDPVRRQRPRVGALLTLALAAVLAPVGVQAQVFLAQGLQFPRLELRFGLHPDDAISH